MKMLQRSNVHAHVYYLILYIIHVYTYKVQCVQQNKPYMLTTKLLLTRSFKCAGPLVSTDRVDILTLYILTTTFCQFCSVFCKSVHEI